jgi:hypothetical protein
MGMYNLESGKIVDTNTAVQVWRSEWADACLCLFPDESYVLFICVEDTAYEVQSPEEAQQKIWDIG